jgi:hypothetical protein
MSAPYATVILPTLNRAETLPIALASVRNQTIENIEIFIVLDGATDQCTQVAKAAESEDSRILVLDLPKAPGAGSANIDMAISKARSQRIFYIDDDDLWTPLHIATLGPCLDSADIVDCPTASLGFMGGIHVAPMTTGNHIMRNLLAQWKYKCTFDVHIAHRKNLCGTKFSWAGAPGAESRPVWAFLGSVAGDRSVHWKSTFSPTSLSVHGACRKSSSSLVRTTELAHWLVQVTNVDAWRDTLVSADYCNHAATLLVADPPQAEGSLDYFSQYFGNRGFDVHQLQERRHQQLYQLFLLGGGHSIPADDLLDVVDRVSRPVIYAQNIHGTYGLINRAYGPDRAVEILNAFDAAEMVNPAGYWGILGLAFFAVGDHAQAMNAIEHACVVGPDPNSMFVDCKAQIEAAPRHT